MSNTTAPGYASPALSADWPSGYPADYPFTARETDALVERIRHLDAPERAPEPVRLPVPLIREDGSSRTEALDLAPGDWMTVYAVALILTPRPGVANRAQFVAVRMVTVPGRDPITPKDATTRATEAILETWSDEWGTPDDYGVPVGAVSMLTMQLPE